MKKQYLIPLLIIIIATIAAFLFLYYFGYLFKKLEVYGGCACDTLASYGDCESGTCTATCPSGTCSYGSGGCVIVTYYWDWTFAARYYNSFGTSRSIGSPRHWEVYKCVNTPYRSSCTKSYISCSNLIATESDSFTESSEAGNRAYSCPSTYSGYNVKECKLNIYCGHSYTEGIGLTATIPKDYTAHYYTYQGESYKMEICKEVCTEGWLNEYTCSGDMLRRKYQNADCSTTWKDYKNCNNDDYYSSCSWSCSDSTTRKCTRTFYDYYCSGTSCTYTTKDGSYTEACSSGQVCENGQCISKPDIRVESFVTAPSSGGSGQTISVTVRYKNYGTASGTIKIESGVICDAWAQAWGFPLSLFMPLSTSSIAQCCEGNMYIEDKQLTLGAGQTEDVTFSLKLPTSSTIDVCGKNSGYNWGSSFTLYAITFNECYAGSTSYITKDFAICSDECTLGYLGCRGNEKWGCIKDCDADTCTEWCYASTCPSGTTCIKYSDTEVGCEAEVPKGELIVNWINIILSILGFK